MPAFSLLTPMPGLPWYLLPLWPLIFWRIQRLKRWFRAAGGPGSQMLWGVMWNGRVVVLQLSDDLSGHRSGIFRAPVSDRLRLAFADTTSPCSRRMPGPQAILSGRAARDPGLRREYGFNLPDT
ncbi:hypothetical protein [Hyphomonas sp.]|uniref:hypothetical protein n=1 Tax=Hyphomonas sp. TaxID=87 RepID=UPI0030F9D676